MKNPIRRSPGIHRLPRTFHTNLNDFRDFLSFLDDNLKSFSNEASLRQEKGVRFVYLVDFQEIYYWLAPYLRLTLDVPEPVLARHLTCRAFFENIDEDFALPLGTLAELAVFLRTLKAAVGLLREAAAAEDPAAALDELITYFAAQRFLSEPRSLALISGGDGSRQFAAQAKLLAILSNYESALSKVAALLSHRHLCPLRPMAERVDPEYFGERYRDALLELSNASEKRKIFGNKADAYNLALLCSLNSGSARTDAQAEHGDPICFKLITDTKSILRLPQGSTIDAELTLRKAFGLPFSVRLLEQYEAILLKRLVKKYAMANGDHAIGDMLVWTTRALTAFDSLRRRAIASVDVEAFFESLMDPKILTDRDAILKSRSNILTLYEFFAKEKELTGDFRPMIAREQLLAGFPADADVAPSQLVAQSVAAVDDAISTVYKLMHAADPTGLKLTPLQAGSSDEEWINPVLSLKQLGYEVKKSVRSGDWTWELIGVEANKVVLRIESQSSSPPCWTITWIALIPLLRLIDLVLEGGFLRAGSDEKLAVYVLGPFDEQRSTDVTTETLVRFISGVGNPGFVRVESKAMAFIAEIFSVAPLELRAGVIVDSFDKDLVQELFFGLSGYEYNFLLRFLLGRELRDGFDLSVNWGGI